MIDVGRPQHLTTEQVQAEVSALRPRDVISDEAAVAIASWFASPRGHGAVFAALSTTGRVVFEDLADAILHEIPTQESNRGALLELLAWGCVKDRPTGRICEAHEIVRSTRAGEEGGTDEEHR